MSLNQLSGDYVHAGTKASTIVCRTTLLVVSRRLSVRFVLDDFDPVSVRVEYESNIVHPAV